MIGSTTSLKNFKQTFIRYNLYVRRRDYDHRWEVVKRIPNPQYNYKDSVWKGARTAKGKIIKPMIWVTQFVYHTRREAIEKAKELGGVRVQQRQHVQPVK